MVRRNNAVRQGVAAKESILRISDRVESAVRSGIRDLRRLSGLKGLERLRVELDSLGIDISKGRLTQAQADMLIQDTVRARQYAKSYAKAWRTGAKGETIGEATRAANQSTQGSLTRTAVTESSNAYSETKRAGAKSIGANLYRVWDAVLDRRVCPICERADGNIVGLRERFPAGEPGATHPNCRCTWSVLSESEVSERGDTLIQAA